METIKLKIGAALVSKQSDAEKCNAEQMKLKKEIDGFKMLVQETKDIIDLYKNGIEEMRVAQEIQFEKMSVSLYSRYQRLLDRESGVLKVERDFNQEHICSRKASDWCN